VVIKTFFPSKLNLFYFFHPFGSFVLYSPRCRCLSRITPSGLLRFSVNTFRHFVGLHVGGIGPSQGLSLQRTAQHREPRTYTNTSSGIRTYDHNVRLRRRFFGYNLHFVVYQCVPILHPSFPQFRVSSVS
jgi:hypothetical protein